MTHTHRHHLRQALSSCGGDRGASSMQAQTVARAMGMLDKMKVQAAPPPPGSAQDPVCHMKVDPARAAGRSTHDGVTYYFCSGSCKTRFDADPKKYLSSSGPHSM